jgi:hypothetical protein
MSISWLQAPQSGMPVLPVTTKRSALQNLRRSSFASYYSLLKGHYCYRAAKCKRLYEKLM